MFFQRKIEKNYSVSVCQRCPLTYVTKLLEQEHQTKNTIKWIIENLYFDPREVKHLSE